MKRRESLNHVKFGEIRIAEDHKGNTWYLAQDVRKALGLSVYYLNSKVNMRHKQKVDRRIFGLKAAGTGMTVVDKEGINTMIFFSQKPTKFDFKNWIFGEVMEHTPKITTSTEPNRSNLQIFNNDMFGNVRAITDDNGEPWFVAKDIATVLGYTNPLKAIRTHCKGVNEMDTPTTGGVQTIKIIPERDVYRLIMRSKLPAAEQFEDWVVGDVLPAIRKTGGYIIDKEDDTPEQILARAVLVAQDTIQRKEKKIKELDDRISILSHVNKTYTATEIAKECGFRSAAALNQELHNRGIQYKQNGTWVLYSKFADLGYTQIKQDVLDSGVVYYSRRFTQAGREWILNMFS